MAGLKSNHVESAISETAKAVGITLKSKQFEAIYNFCLQNDVFVSLPTGYGKSVIYGLLPSIFDKITGRDGSILVCITPLIAIMQEQKAKFCAMGMNAEFVGEAQSDPSAQSRVVNGEVQLVLISPENILCNYNYRNMMLSSVYKEKLIGVAVDEAHCVKTWGDDFRRAFAAIGELRCLIPDSVKMLALTATATQGTFDAVVKRLSLKDPITVALTPCRPNIKLIVRPPINLQEFAFELSEKLKSLKSKYPKTLLFCHTYQDCSKFYIYINHFLKRHKTDPPGLPNELEYRLITMYTRASTTQFKEAVTTLFSERSSTLRMIVATAAFGMGIDYPDIDQIIHWGSPSTVEQYAQEIGCAGREGQKACAILIRRKLDRHTELTMKCYGENNEECRRTKLYKGFIMYEPCISSNKCQCCDICAINCKCVQCKK